MWRKSYSSGTDSNDFFSAHPDTVTAERINEALRSCAEQYGTKSVEYGRQLMLCGAECFGNYDLAQASVLIKRGVSIISQYGDGPFDGRDTVDEIFLHDVMTGVNIIQDYNALHHCRRATELKRQYFGSNSKIHLNGLLILSRLQAQRFRYRESMKTHNKGYEAYVKLIKDEFCRRGERDRANYWQTVKGYIYATVDLAAQTSSQQATRRTRSLAGPAYNALLLYKGLLLNTTVGFENHVKNSGVQDAINLLEQKKLLAANNAPDSVIDSIDLVILQYLREDGKPYTIPSLDITWDSVLAALGDDDLAIEFFRDRKNEYGAVLLRKDWQTPLIVMLDNELKISGNYKSLDDALKLQMQIDYSYNANDLWQLSRAVWTDEIVKHFPKTKDGRIFFSADGELQVNGIENLPFLPIKNPQKNNDEFWREKYHTVSEIYNVHRLSSTRELAMKRQYASNYRAAVFGGIKYDIPRKRMVENFREPRSNGGLKLVVHGKKRNTLDSLPGTRIEANAVSDLLGRGLQNRFEVHKFMDDYGTEEEFKGLSSKNYQIVHVATHGFALNDGNASFISEADANNPLARSGLLLAGANASWNGFPTRGREDGILTALEISRMDLRSTDIVALSACETGLGAIGEDGVFGLQRGFKMAGVGAILMSLWQVNDDATCFLMTEFYRNWIEGMSKHEAFEEAKRQVRSHDGWESPWFWAAFILLDAID